MSVEYKPSSKLEEIAKKVIDDHVNLVHLESPDCRILYQYCTQQKMKKDKIVYADCEKIKEKLKAFLPYDFIITFYEPNTMMLSQEYLEKLMYHELLHVGFEGAGKYYIVPHDIEDFRDVIDKWGLDWIKRK